MIRRNLAGLLVLAGVFSTTMARAEVKTESIKLGTLAPAESPWGQVFKVWQKAVRERTKFPDGQKSPDGKDSSVDLTFFWNGQQGDEAAVVDASRVPEGDRRHLQDRVAGEQRDQGVDVGGFECADVALDRLPDGPVVGLEQGVLPIGPFDDGALEFSGEFDGAVARAIHDEDVGDAAIAKCGDDSLGDSACTDDEGGVAGEFAEDAFGEFYTGGGHGHGAHTELRFGANALANFERALEEPI